MLQFEHIRVRTPKPMQIPPNVIHCETQPTSACRPVLTRPGAQQQQQGTQASCWEGPLLLQEQPPLLWVQGCHPRPLQDSRTSHMQKARGAGCTTQGVLLCGTCSTCWYIKAKQSAHPCKSCSKTASKQSAGQRGHKQTHVSTSTTRLHSRALLVHTASKQLLTVEKRVSRRHI